MKRTILALAVTSAFAGLAQADDALTVYGKANVSLQSTNEAGTNNFSELKSNASRFGLKGKTALDGGLEVFYKMEWEVDLTDKSKGSTDNIKSRNQIVGLRGNFGSIFVGRHDTPMKSVQKKIDLFNDYDGDMKHIINGENRKSNILQYSTKKLNGAFQANVAFIPGEDPANGNTGLADATSASVTFDKNGLYLGVAYDSDVDGQNVKTTRFVSQFNRKAFQLGFLYENTDNGTNKENGYVTSGAYKMGKETFKVQYADSKIWSLGVSSSNKYSTMTSVGWDHKLGKHTKVFTWYTNGELGATSQNDKFVAVGLEHKF